MAKTVVKHTFNCSKPSLDDQVEALSGKMSDLKQLMVNHIAKIGELVLHVSKHL
jgi:hypothetical protein